MDREIKRKIELCKRADNAEWEEVIVVAKHLTEDQRTYMQEHPPGLVQALWAHFEATRDRCGCETATHERPGCTVPFIEKLLLEAEFD